ncbi:MAG TPA: hypothetical protein VH186_05410 [Chloroflexia bacterium]|nr:hypothetical protein [Chloroflexia bacterium]
MAKHKEFEKVSQIIPAKPGWEAIYAGPLEEAPFYLAQPVVCWALVEENPTTVIGMVAHRKAMGELVFAGAVENFLGYNYPGCAENWDQEVLRLREGKKHE